jgi:formate hydrogenlyase transcriptional activator
MFISQSSEGIFREDMDAPIAINLPEDEMIQHILRERREDIPLLVEHFVRRYSARMNKSITSIPARTMETLVQWAWPGNIRELENFMERSVILTPGLVLQVPLSELNTAPAESNGDTLRERERERIVRALRECNGQLGGPDGAAARLGLKRTTLQSKAYPFRNRSRRLSRVNGRETRLRWDAR